MTDVDELKNRALVSDLMDGRLRGNAFSQAVELANSNDTGRAAWHVNHVIGDILRFGDSAAAAADAQFVDRFRGRFEQAQLTTGLSPDRSGRVEFADGTIKSRLGSTSSNSSNFRWKLAAGFASVAAVVAIGWNSFTGAGGPDFAPAGAPQLAKAGVTAAPNQESQIMIRDPHLDALLAAHKQFGGTSALQMPAGFLRNATFESPTR